MDWTVCSHTLSDLIDRELDLTVQLGQALAGERDALEVVDPIALDRATAWKQKCVEHLDDIDAERRHMCSALGLAPDRAGMERLLLQADPEGSLANRWQLLLSQLEACRSVNTENGSLVRLQKGRVTDALGILRGEPANNAVYGDDGEVDETSGNHVHAEI